MLLPGEKLLQGEDLAPIPQRALRQEPHLGERIHYDAGWFRSLDLPEQHPHRLAELHLGRVEHRLSAFAGRLGLGRHQLEDVDPLERPAMRFRGGAKLVGGLGQGDVERLLARLASGKQELQAERRLARAGSAFDEMDAVPDEAAAKNVVEIRDPR